MTVATLPAPNLQHSLSCLSLSSNPRPSASPAVITVFPPSNLSGTKSNLSSHKAFPIPHLSYAGGVAQRITLDVPLEAGSDRDSAFITSHSRVLRFYNLPPLPSVFLRDLFINTSQVNKSVVPTPRSLWTRRPEHAGGVPNDGLWAVFATHEEVRLLVHSHNHVNRIGKRPCMPVRGVRHRRDNTQFFYTFLFLNTLPVFLMFSFHPSIATYINTTEC